MSATWRSGTVTTWLNTSFQIRFRVIDGLTVRFALGEDRREQALLLSPWPESLFAFEPVWSWLAEHAHLVAIDLPGFGHSQRCDALLSPRAMSDFVLRAADAFGLEHPHVIGPGTGTAAALFAAARYPARLRSLVVGSGAAAVPLQLGGALKDWVEAPDLDRVRRADPRQIVAGALAGIRRYALPDTVREDYFTPARVTGSSRRCATCAPTRPNSRYCAACCRESARRCRSSPEPRTPWCRRSTPSSSTTGCRTASSTFSTRATSPGKTPRTSMRDSSRPGGAGATRPPARRSRADRDHTKLAETRMSEKEAQMRPVMRYLSTVAFQADALFASELQRSGKPSAGQVRQAAAAAIRAFGYPGCVEQVAQEFGDHPETAVIRMRWARAMAWEAFAGSAPDPGPRADAGPVLPVRPRLPAEQTSDSPGDGPYELTGQLPGLPHLPVAGSRLG